MSILYYFIDEETRKLRPEAAHKVVAQKDHNADVIRVGIPETMDSVDLETSAVRCMYQRPKETEVRSKTAAYYDTSGGYLWYDWTLQEGDTAKAGKINFSVCLQHIEGGLLTVDWNTTIGEIHVKTSYHSDDGDSSDETITPTAIERIAVLEATVDRLKNISSGVPQAVGDISDMTDTTKIYVLSTDGKWYWYDGTDWVVGGVYGAASTDTTLTQPGMPADAEAAGEAINTLSEDIGVLMPEATEEVVGKALIVKDVEAGKVTEYEFGEAGGVDSYTFVPPNMYDKDNKVGTMTINGTSVSGLSNWIELKAGAVYTTDYTSTAFYFFDANKEYLSTQTLINTPNRILADADGYLLIRTKGADKSFVRGSYLEYNPGVVSRWNGKRWLAIGDSITAIDHADKGYPFIVGSNLGMEVTNVGRSGKVMAFFHDLIPQYADDYDIITVMLGTNNHGYNTAIGSLNDTYYQQEDYDSNNSFYAQTQRVADLLIAKYPYAVIAFFTPIRRAVGASDGSDWANSLGLTTKAYADAVKAVCDYYGLPCLDLYTHGINPRYDAIRSTFFVGGDGTHPNNAGHAKYTAPVINGLLFDLAPFAYDSPIISISATYTGGEVPAGTNLNSLTGLTVTAHRANGVSEEVTGYTLSGTIGIGQNTITVTYDGHTATFSVTGIDVPVFTLLHQYTYTAGGEDFGNDIKGFHDEVGDYDISTEYDSAKVRGASDSSAATLASWGLYPGDSFTLEFLGVKRTSRYPQSQGIDFLMTSGTARNTASMGRGSTDRFAAVNQGGTVTQATATPLNIGYYGGENGTTSTVESSENTFAPQNGEPQDIIVRYDASTGHVTSYVDTVKFHDFYVNSVRKQYIHTDGISLDAANVITSAVVIFSKIKIYKGVETDT